jgi:hypothetical protein
MADHQQQADFTVTIRADYALWPGDGVFVVRYSAVELGADGWLLVDRSGRRSELRPYRVGVAGLDRRRPR